MTNAAEVRENTQPLAAIGKAARKIGGEPPKNATREKRARDDQKLTTAL